MNSLSRGILVPRVTSFTFTQKSTQRYINPSIYLLDSNNRGSPPSTRNIRTQIVSQALAARHAESGDGFLKKIFKKYNIFSVANSRLKRTGYYLYESVADNINYAEFFIEFNMADSFFSWYLITELHVWMLMVRTMTEQEDGKLVRNNLVEAMWNDATTRAKVLWSESPGGVRRSIVELNEQFNCAIIGYDEGVNGEDKVLAGAIWRRIFQLEHNNPEDVEKLLIYVRKQIHHLDNLPWKDILSKPDIKWLPLNNP